MDPLAKDVAFRQHAEFFGNPTALLVRVGEDGQTSRFSYRTLRDKVVAKKWISTKAKYWPGKPAASLAGSDHPQHRSHAHPEIASNALDAGPLGPGRDDRRHLVRIAILDPRPGRAGRLPPSPGLDQP